MSAKAIDNFFKVRSEREPAPATEVEPIDNLGAFGWLRGIRDRALMLELRHRDGSITAVGYAWLHRADFDRSEGIMLYFGEKKIKITGQRLNAERIPNIRLFDGIVRHRVPWIQEADGAQLMEAEKDAIIIEAIKIE